MKFLVKPIKDKFEGYCFGSSRAVQNHYGQAGCDAVATPIYSYCPRR